MNITFYISFVGIALVVMFLLIYWWNKSKEATGIQDPEYKN